MGLGDSRATTSPGGEAGTPFSVSWRSGAQAPIHEMRTTTAIRCGPSIRNRGVTFPHPKGVGGRWLGLLLLLFPFPRSPAGIGPPSPQGPPVRPGHCPHGALRPCGTLLAGSMDRPAWTAPERREREGKVGKENDGPPPRGLSRMKGDPLRRSVTLSPGLLEPLPLTMPST
jgi:hypothetical protein